MKLEVPSRLDGYRADAVIADLLKVTRSSLKQRIPGRRIRINGLSRSFSHCCREGDLLELELKPLPEILLKPEPLFLEILYEDSHFLAVNKPAGMVVHAGGGVREGTLVNALLHHLGTLPGFEDSPRPGIVHRLDRETSGVLLAAKTPRALHRLQSQFSERTVRKEYRAVVFSNIPENMSLIEEPIGRHFRDRKKMSVSGIRPRAARTRIRVLERFGDFCLVAAFPETGRTHQIRVHLSHVKHPVAGDRVYSRGQTRGLPAALLSRQMLHALTIRFRHPESGEAMECTAPLPEDFLSLLAYLRKKDRA
jgi:23S rRNA pseudouridine1911/1915/1917 synthase